jgi:hypothetical protein
MVMEQVYYVIIPPDAIIATNERSPQCRKRVTNSSANHSVCS